MALEASRLLFLLLCFTILYLSNGSKSENVKPVITSISLVNVTFITNANNEDFRRMLVELRGSDLHSSMIVRLTSHLSERRTECVNETDSDLFGYSFKEEWLNSTFAYMTLTVPCAVEFSKHLYVCVGSRDLKNDGALNLLNRTFRGEVIKWLHQGKNVTLNEDFSGSDLQVSSDSSNHSAPRCGRRGGRRRRAEPPSSEPSTAAAAPASAPAAAAPAAAAASASASAPDRRVEAASGPAPAEAGGGGVGGVTEVAVGVPLRVTGLRVEWAAREPVLGADGVVGLLAGTDVRLRLFGQGLANRTRFTLTRRAQERGICAYPLPHIHELEADAADERSATVKMRVPVAVDGDDGVFYVCVMEPLDEAQAAAGAGAAAVAAPAPASASGEAAEGEAAERWLHQGNAPWLAIRSYEKLLPTWLSITIIVVCLTFSALFSGLNLGLMSMDQTDLKIVANTGSEQERRYAQAIMPVRKMGNYLLCSILLGNVLVNSTFTILLDDLTSGLVAIVGSTLAIVVFGEISPQAVCSRHGLAVGAKTIYITKMVMLITFPLSYPISKLLDRLLGVELGNVYNRERLKELVTNEYNDLEKDEVNIIAGALEFRKKVVSDVMTKLEDVFMLSNDAILDFETVSEIMKQGYSRIPVYDGVRSNIVTVLYIKDLAFVDPDDNTPLSTLCNFYQNPCNFVFEDTTLDIMFKQFKEGIKGHMAIVQRVNSEGEGDPFYETVGIVTLEDVIEELIQSEIVDETDVWTDNRSKRRRNEKTNRQDFTVFAERRENQRIHISPQLTLATFQYLSTAVNAFKPDNISETILRRLLKQDVIYHIKVKNKEKARNDPQCIIYSQGKAVDYFVLILEGRVEVTVGRENMMFESGPFTYFGSQALTQNIGVADSPTSPAPQNLGSLQSVNLDSILRYTFVPDYSVRAITEVFYIKIKRSLYLAAKRATLMEMAKKDNQTDFDDEVEKLLHSLDEDDRSQGPMDSPPSHRIQMDKDFLQHQVAACAERSASLVGNDITMLSGSKSSGLSPPPPAHSAGSPGGASIGGLIGRELNGSRKLSAHLSPTKVIGEGTNLLMDGKDGDKISEKYKSTSPKQSIDDSEERTILLPKPASNTKC
ncbi:hypothetical protein R5R35_013888 [Gryllus longicercus]|uniref:Metal transporter CNNM4 n=1 Tax=Gryllus longicercus TaxID=2509291 RepID=A0AAN9VT23_9ORTH